MATSLSSFRGSPVLGLEVSAILLWVERVTKAPVVAKGLNKGWEAMKDRMHLSKSENRLEAVCVLLLPRR
jgi:hypothetical protein